MTHPIVTYAVIGGPLDGWLIAVRKDRDHYDVQLPSKPFSLREALSRVREGGMVVDRFTYRLHGARSGTHLLQWASPEGMTEAEAMAKLTNNAGALEAALRAYTEGREFNR